MKGMKELDLEDLELITDKDIIMKGGAAGPPPAPPAVGDFNTDHPLEASLLQIVERGVDDIVIQIKKKLGSNIVNTNIYAKKIVEILDTLSTSITTNLDTANGVGKASPDDENILITKIDGKYKAFPQQHYKDLKLVTGQPEYDALPDAAGNNQKIIADKLKYFYENSKYKTDGYGLPNQIRQINMTTLDSNQIAGVNPTNVIQKETTNVAEIERRLNNCQYLELLYLVKHEELMKTFAFTLNLFDKYKYSIKVLLFVLKNLVYKTGPAVPGGPGGPAGPNIKLPKALIPNIMKLIQDQKQVQEVITSMQDTLDENSAKYTTKDAAGARIPNAGVDREAVVNLASLSRDDSNATPPVQPSEGKLNFSLSTMNLSPPNLSNIKPDP